MGCISLQLVLGGRITPVSVTNLCNLITHPTGIPPVAEDAPV